MRQYTRTQYNIYPSLSWLVVVANLASLYFKGVVIIGWWWVALIYLFELTILVMIEKTTNKLEAFEKARRK